MAKYKNPDFPNTPVSLTTSFLLPSGIMEEANICVKNLDITKTTFITKLINDFVRQMDYGIPTSTKNGLDGRNRVVRFVRDVSRVDYVKKREHIDLETYPAEMLPKGKRTACGGTEPVEETVTLKKYSVALGKNVHSPFMRICDEYGYSAASVLAFLIHDFYIDYLNAKQVEKREEDRLRAYQDYFGVSYHYLDD